MPLLERDGLLDEMASRLRAAARGRGSVVLLGAEAGAGKTSVVLEFARRSGRSAHVLIGCCDPLTTPRPLSPLIDIALDPRSRLSGSFAASAAPYELFTAIQTLNPYAHEIAGEFVTRAADLLAQVHGEKPQTD